MERDEFLSRLNEDLSTEYQSIVQYTQHIATIKGVEYQALIEELRKHISQELNHALTLAEQIDFLGGTPTVAVPTIQDATESRAALKLDLDLERRQLDRYRSRVQEAVELGLPDVAEALKPLLEQTQDHVMDLESALGE
ncbi:MAG: ferritin-like domain-containing protein [Actinocatenispora sp.]